MNDKKELSKEAILWQNVAETNSYYTEKSILKAMEEYTAPVVVALKEAVALIKAWHNADEVWDIYYNNAPEMKHIREVLNRYP